MESKELAVANKAFEFRINNKEDQQAASLLLADISSRYKEVEAKRVELVKPLNDHVAKINNDFKPILDKLKNAKYDLQHKMAKWTSSENERLEAERLANLAEAMAKQARLEQEAIKAVHDGNREQAEELLKAKDSVTVPNVYETPKVNGFHTRDIWKHNVVDINLVPDEYITKEVNTSALNSVDYNTKVNNSIAGILFYKETIGVSKS